MKKVCIILMGLFWLIGLAMDAGAQGYRLVGMVSLRVPVTAAKMTNLVFPMPVAAGVKVSRDVLVQRPKGVVNVIELKAVRANFKETNLSVYGKDGRLYSFVLHYVEDTTVLNYRVLFDDESSEEGLLGERRIVMLQGLPVDGATLDSDALALSSRPGFLHRSVSSGGVRLSLRGVYLRDSLLWLCLGLRNRTAIGFIPAYMRVFVKDARRIKRTASQEVEMLPVYPGLLEPVPGGGSRLLTIGLTPFVPGKGKKLVVELADAGGGRVLELEVKDVSKARIREL
jgi:hypothetical protein